MSQTIRGKKGDTLNRQEISYSPGEGYSCNWTHEGPKDAIIPLMQQLAALGFQFNYVSDQSPLASIQYQTIGSADPSTPETPSVIWEFFAGSAEIDFLDARTEMDGTNGKLNLNNIDDVELQGTREELQNWDGTNELDPDTDIGDHDIAFRLMASGIRSHPIEVPTLRATRIVSSKYPVKVGISNVGRIIKTDTLVIQEAIPEDILFDLPQSSTVTRKILNLEYVFNYGWRKQHPNAQQIGGGRWNVAQQWVYGLWAVKQFGTAL